MRYLESLIIVTVEHLLIAEKEAGLSQQEVDKGLDEQTEVTEVEMDNGDMEETEDNQGDIGDNMEELTLTFGETLMKVISRM